MNLTSPSVIKNLLKKHNLWAKKRFGQHFLVDRNILDKILKTANLSKEDVVLEIGPGIGTLTRELCEKAKKVIVVEIDKKILEILNEVMKEEVKSKKLKIIEGDILKIENCPEGIPWDKLKIENFKIVANIPYQITSSLLEKFLTAKDKPSEMVLLVQKEVAQKICCQPPDMNRLGILVQFYGKPEIIQKVSKNSFWPPPAVDSAILKITTGQRFKIKNPKIFLDLVKKGFSQKRKQLKNIFELKKLQKAKIDPQARAETLSLKDWFKLYRVFKKEREQPTKAR